MEVSWAVAHGLALDTVLLCDLSFPIRSKRRFTAHIRSCSTFAGST